jgi:hypothetical protein
VGEREREREKGFYWRAGLKVGFPLVVHIHSWALCLSAALWYALKVLKLNVVFDFHWFLQ